MPPPSAPAKPDEWYLDLLRADPRLSEKSKVQYIMNLRTLVRETDDRGVEHVLRHADRAMAALAARFKRRGTPPPSPQSVLAYCAAVGAVLKRLPPEHRERLGGEAALRRDWDACTAGFTAQVRAKYDNWEASDRQRDNFVPWEGLVARRVQLGADPQTHGSRQHLLLAFLTYLPPMRTSNYGTLRLFDETNRPPRRGALRRQMEDERWNYVYLGKRRGTLTISDYKTANHYRRKALPSPAATEGGGGGGEGMDAQMRAMGRSPSPPPRGVVVEEPFAAGPMVIPKGVYDDKAATRTGELPPQLFDLLRASAQRDPRGWVFVNSAGQPYLENTFHKHMAATLRQTFHGRAVSVDLVRHAAAIWLDRHHRHDAKVLAYFRFWMMHSRDMQGEYVLAHNMTGGGSGARDSDAAEGGAL